MSSSSVSSSKDYSYLSMSLSSSSSASSSKDSDLPSEPPSKKQRGEEVLAEDPNRAALTQSPFGKGKFSSNLCLQIMQFAIDPQDYARSKPENKETERALFRTCRYFRELEVPFMRLEKTAVLNAFINRDTIKGQLTKLRNYSLLQDMMKHHHTLIITTRLAVETFNMFPAMFPAIKTIQMSGICTIGDQPRRFDNFTRLTTLEITIKDVTLQKELEYISRAQSLEELHLYDNEPGTPIAIEDLNVVLKQVLKLKNLHIFNCGAYDHHDVSDDQITTETFEQVIAHPRSWTKLHLFNCQGITEDQFTRLFSRHTELQVLEFLAFTEAPGFRGRAIKQLAQSCTKLQSLTFYQDEEDEEMEVSFEEASYLASLKSLTKLDCNGPWLSDKALAEFAKLTNLTSLKIDTGSSLTDKGFEPFTSMCTKFVNFNLTYNWKQPGGISPTVLQKFIANNPRLQSLEITTKQKPPMLMTPGVIDALIKCQDLQVLSIGKPPKIEDIHKLAAFRKEVIINDNPSKRNAETIHIEFPWLGRKHEYDAETSEYAKRLRKASDIYAQIVKKIAKG